MTKRYVIVQESTDESGQRGVDAVYAGVGTGWYGWEAKLALEALTNWLYETGQLDQGTRATIVQVSPVPDRPRGLMARAVMEAEAAQQLKGEQARQVVAAMVCEAKNPALGTPCVCTTRHVHHRDEAGRQWTNTGEAPLALVTEVDPPVSSLWAANQEVKP